MKKPTKRALIKKLDTIFSLWVRWSAAKDGMVECYTCGVIKPVKEMQCGHFVSRANYCIRWESDNCRPQCLGCNVYKAGEQYIFGKKLEAELGHGRVEQLHELKGQVSGFSVSDYQDMIEDYKEKLRHIPTAT